MTADDDLNGLGVSAELERIGRAEIVIGVPGVISANAASPAVEAIREGLGRYYPRSPCVIVTAGGGAPAAAPPQPKGPYPVLALRPGARPMVDLAAPLGAWSVGRGAVHGVLRIADRLGARACVLVDADLRGLCPEWTRRLIEPVLRESFDLVAPLYDRHRYDGLLTSSLVYPLTRALYGLRVRQPVGGHLALSPRLVGRLLHSGLWEREAGPVALDAWMTTTAVAEGLRVSQSHVGAWRRASQDAESELSAVFARVVSTVFGLMEDYRPTWWAVVGTVEIPSHGPPPTLGLEPASVNVDRMISTFRQGVADLAPLWRRALAPETADTLAALVEEGAAAFRFPAEMWAAAVYDCAAAYHRRLLPRRHLLRAMIPLYLGRTAAFVLGTESGDAAAAEGEAEAVCGAFEAMKPHLLDRWDSPRP